MSGKLYVVATPIGNMGDITQRAIDTLSTVDLIAAEDTRHTGLLLARLGISARLISCHEHNETGRVGRIIDELSAGHDVALVSDAGTPGISDPGATVIAEAIAAGFDVVPVPGATAFVSALLVSGLPTATFLFRGFLPRKARERREALAELAAVKATLVFYEAPHRLRAMLADLAAVFGGGDGGDDGGRGRPRRCAVCWELTKKFERVWRGTVDEAVEAAGSDTRGEIVVVVEGAGGDGSGEEPGGDDRAGGSPDVNSQLAEAAVEAVSRAEAGNASLKDAAGQVARERMLPVRRVYAEAIRVRENQTD